MTKLTQPRVQLAPGPMGWAADVADAEFRAVDLLEVLGALGLVLPGALGIAPVLTPLAAVGLALTIVGAIATHVRMGETDRLAVPDRPDTVLAEAPRVSRGQSRDESHELCDDRSHRSMSACAESSRERKPWPPQTS